MQGLVHIYTGDGKGKTTAAVGLGRNLNKFTWNMNENELQKAAAVPKEQFDYALKEVITDEWDILILDEIMAAISTGMVPLQDVLDFIKSKPNRLEIVLTGRNVPDSLIEAADYVSDIHEVKHPMKKGIIARRGIED